MSGYELYKMTTNQLKNSHFDKVILSIGSCESHGLHLPHGTDALVSYKLSCKVAEQVKGLLVLPPITVGYSGHYDDFPFTLTLGYDTTTQVIYDIIESVIRNGIHKIFLMNGHDGNIAPLEIASRKIKEKYPDARIAALTEWWITAGKLLPPDTFEVWDGLGHAGEGESSICYHMFPQWCEPNQAQDVIPDHLPEYIDIKWDFAELTHTGNTGAATKATADKGEKMTEALVKCITDAMVNLDKNNWSYSTTNASRQL